MSDFAPFRTCCPSRRRVVRRGSERGSVLAEYVLVFGLTMFMFFAGLQAMMWAYAKQASGSAAREIAQSIALGEDSAAGEAFLEATAARWMPDAGVAIDDDGVNVTVTITGNVTEIIPVPWDISIETVSIMPNELFVPAR